ncbi:MAG: DUF1015 domain-containing protein [Deltaproteobacteria bacterium]|nr:DUF1015 domain-containing protein [Deltaproteobacteria bacterium]
MRFDTIGLKAPTVLLPKKGVDLTKWSVVACDQFTSQPEYWEKAKSIVGNNPSTLNLIFPEVYLESKTHNRDELIGSINQHMKKYLDQNILIPQKPGFILVDRQTPHTPSRKGLIVALDLEKYDYNKGSQTLIRATEGTVLDRLPPRIKIRKNAPIELPHIMVLIDDPGRTVIEPLFHKNLELIYDFDLMLDGGHIKTYRVDEPGLVKTVADTITALSSKEMMASKYGSTENGILLYAMGDGNHSLATAKAIWEDLKKTANKQDIMDHPARYALVELVNVHDAGLTFEPIHRVLFHVQADSLLKAMKNHFEKLGSSLTKTVFTSVGTAEKELKNFIPKKTEHIIAFVAEGVSGFISIENPKLNLAVGTLQSFLDDYLVSHKETKIDYIHGTGVVTDLGSQQGNMGFYLPAMAKQDLFKTVYLDGALPRKTFSMGEACEKRYYLECRSILPA